MCDHRISITVDILSLNFFFFYQVSVQERKEGRNHVLSAYFVPNTVLKALQISHSGDELSLIGELESVPKSL